MRENAAVIQFFLGIAFLLFSANLFGYIFHTLKLPKVIGEICGGIILGPACFGRVYPQFFQLLFTNNSKLIAAFSLLGLILLMFSSGFEVNTAFAKEDQKIIYTMMITSTVIPLLVGWISTYFFDISKLSGSAHQMISLKIVIAIAIAITSIPVLSKIFFDLQIMNTKFAKIVLGTATIHDLILWVLLSFATSLVNKTTLSISTIAIQIGFTLAFFIVALKIIPFLIQRMQKGKYKFIPEHYEASFLFIVLFVFFLVADFLSVDVIFGAFLAGIVIGFVRSPKFEEIKVHIKSISFAFFIPVYFAIVGLKLDFLHHFDLIFCISFILFALIVQGLTIFITAKLLRHSTMSSMNLAMAINTRGGPCIVLATVAFDFNIIGPQFFSTLVLLAIISSLISGTWLRWVISRNLELYDFEHDKENFISV